MKSHAEYNYLAIPEIMSKGSGRVFSLIAFNSYDSYAFNFWLCMWLYFLDNVHSIEGVVTHHTMVKVKIAIDFLHWNDVFIPTDFLSFKN